MIDKSVWTDLNYAERMMAADRRLKTAPESLTDADIEALDAYYGNGEQARRARDAAVAAKATAIQRAMTAPRPAMPARSRSMDEVNQIAEQLDDLRKDMLDLELSNDVFEQRLERYLSKLDKHNIEVPANTVLMLLMHHVRQMNNANARRNERILKLEHAALQTNTANRVTGVTWAGPHQSGATYRSGELCQKNGLWLCIVSETTATPGTAPADWKLVVHRKLVPKNDDET